VRYKRAVIDSLCLSMNNFENVFADIFSMADGLKALITIDGYIEKGKNINVYGNCIGKYIEIDIDHMELTNVSADDTMSVLFIERAGLYADQRLADKLMEAELKWEEEKTKD